MNAGEVSYTKQETKSLSEKICQGLKPRLWDPRLRRILAPSPLWGGMDPVIWWSHPSTKIPIALNETIPQAGTSSSQKTTSGHALEVPSGLEKLGLRSLAGGSTAPLATPNPFSKGFTPIRKTEVLHPRSLRSSNYLDLGSPTYNNNLCICKPARKHDWRLDSQQCSY